LKRLHLLLIKSYIGPFILTFFITLFILVMQFLWKYVDEFVGKGLEWYIVVELLFYATVNLVTMSMPLAVLLSAIMTFGNLGENNELIAIKSSGVSLLRFMKPLLVFISFIGIGMFFFANNIAPNANVKFASLLYDIRQKKPAIDIKPGIFYKGIENYVIRIGSKDKETQMMSQVSIYDHSKHDGGRTVMRAEKGKMQISDDEQFLVITLYNGSTYIEEVSNKEEKTYFPLYRTKFKEQVIRMNLIDFKFQRTKDELFKDNYQMLNLTELSDAADTLKLKLNNRKEMYYETIHNKFTLFKDSAIKINPIDTILYPNGILANYDKINQIQILNAAINLLRGFKTHTAATKHELENRYGYLRKFEIEWHRKFVLAVSCVVLFLIGAPLGAIIRKGGLGLPVVIAVFGFLIMYMLEVVGEKLVKQNELTPFSGMWLPVYVLLPIGLFLTYKATTDSAIMETNTYVLWIRKTVDFFRLKIKKQFVKK
jgi:lipopolysaccharide export system permease protein